MRTTTLLGSLLMIGWCQSALCQTREWRPDLVAFDESGHRNVPNRRFDPTHTAGGHWQITDTNWRHYAPTVDIDTRKYPNALSAPEQLQGQVAGKMWAETGYLPWLPYNARLRRDMNLPSPTKAPRAGLPVSPKADSPRSGGVAAKLTLKDQYLTFTRAREFAFNP